MTSGEANSDILEMQTLWTQRRKESLFWWLFLKGLSHHCFCLWSSWFFFRPSKGIAAEIFPEDTSFVGSPRMLTVAFTAPVYFLAHPRSAPSRMLYKYCVMSRDAAPIASAAAAAEDVIMAAIPGAGSVPVQVPSTSPPAPLLVTTASLNAPGAKRLSFSSRQKQFWQPRQWIPLSKRSFAASTCANN